jgi:hypothetical protein
MRAAHDPPHSNGDGRADGVRRCGIPSLCPDRRSAAIDVYRVQADPSFIRLLGRVSGV